jgi:hypothetical protein
MHSRDEVHDEPLSERRHGAKPAESADGAQWVSAVGNASAQQLLRSDTLPRSSGPALAGILARAPRALQRETDEEEPEPEAAGTAGGEADGGAAASPEAAASEVEEEELPE